MKQMQPLTQLTNNSVTHNSYILVSQLEISDENDDYEDEYEYIPVKVRIIPPPAKMEYDPIFAPLFETIGNNVDVDLTQSHIHPDEKISVIADKEVKIEILGENNTEFCILL